MNHNPCVYIFRTEKPNVFKIGRTTDQQTRIKAARTWNPDLTPFDIIKTETPDEATTCENYLHNKLQSKRYAGEFFTVEQSDLEQLIREVRNYLLGDFLPKRREVDRLSKIRNGDKMLVPNQGACDLYLEILKVREQHYEINNKKIYLENQLRLLIGASSGLEGIATWKAEDRVGFDIARFQVDHPDLYACYANKSLIRKLKLLKFKSAQ